MTDTDTVAAAETTPAAPAEPTPLDVKKLISNNDSADLREFKKKVIEVAKEHSRTLHCGEYKSVLRKLGIKETEDKVVVEIETALGLSFEVKVDPLKLLKKSYEEQKTIVLDTLGTVSLNASGSTIGVVKVLPETVTKMELKAKPSPFSNPDFSTQGVWLYTSSEGRVKHFYARFLWDEELRQFTNLEGVPRTMNGNQSTLCGVSSWHAPTTYSDRATGDHCAKCQLRYDRNYLALDQQAAREQEQQR